MRLDHIIQQGVWTGSSDQFDCIDQSARDANVEGYDSYGAYLEAILAAHNEESIEFDRGPVDEIAFAYLGISIMRVWDKLHADA